MSSIKVVQNRRACQNKEWVPKIASQHVQGFDDEPCACARKRLTESSVFQRCKSQPRAYAERDLTFEQYMRRTVVVQG